MFGGQNYDKDERYLVTNYEVPEKVYVILKVTQNT